MDELTQKIRKIRDKIFDASDQIKLKDLENRLGSLKIKTQSEDFWKDSKQAQIIMREVGSLESRVELWKTIMNDSTELVELAALNDDKMISELETQYVDLVEKFNTIKEQLKFSGDHDADNAILSIYAGAGGTDAQDWAAMLLRMYTRYFENHNFKTELINQTPGEEAGIKNATLVVNGDFAYGKLKSEHGVHRLVRLSPFNSDNLRQTSFAKVDVLPKIDRSDQLDIDEKDIKIDVFRAGGHGGQSVNTTDSAVRLTHIPTGIVVSIQNERSQLQNKETAMTILLSKLSQLQIEQQIGRAHV